MYSGSITTLLTNSKHTNEMSIKATCTLQKYDLHTTLATHNIDIFTLHMKCWEDIQRFTINSLEYYTQIS